MAEDKKKQEFMEQPLEGEPTRTNGPREYDVEALHRDQLQGPGAEKSVSSLNFPLPLVALFLVIGFISGAYLMSGGGGDRAGAGAEAGPAQELTFVEQGEKVYGRICQACHQGNGLGIAGQYPPLAGSEWVINGNKVPILIVLHGLQGPIEVKGNNYNGNMAPWATQLSDDDVAAVLTYVRQAWGNTASEVSPQAVAAARELFGNDHPQWTADELLEIGLSTDAGGGAAAEDEGQEDADDEPAAEDAAVLELEPDETRLAALR